MSLGNLPETLSQQILVGIILVEKLGVNVKTPKELNRGMIARKRSSRLCRVSRPRPILSTDGTGNPDPNPRHLVNWCLSQHLGNTACF